MADNTGENLPDNVSELSSFSDSSDEGKKIEEVLPIAEEEADKPAYNDEDLDTIVGFMRNMIYLFDYDSNDFNEEVGEVIKLWLVDVNYPLLFIYYDGDLLTASLSFPKSTFNDLMYFMREPEQLFNIVERFHDDLMFGTLHNDIEGSLLVTLEQVYGPLMLSNTEWSDDVKSHVIGAYNTFMAFLTDIHHKLSGFTLLYVPREGSDMDVQEVVLNRATIKRLEAVVIEWTSQIRSTINDTEHSVPNDLICPSDEYDFWIYRHEILCAIQSQFKNIDIQHILEILDLAQSLYTKPLRDVLNELMIEIEIAESNIPFLKLLVDPCFAIRSLDNEDDLCSQLIYVMHIIRFIGEDSSHLRQDEFITKLFLYLSNEIVSCCRQSIDIEKILSGSPLYGIDVCNIKINCCESYKIIYGEMIEHFKDTFTGNLDYAVIFNRIDAFKQRLYDTLEICHAMTIFGKHSGIDAYKNYRFSCNNAEMYENKCNQVEAIFATGIEKIQTVSGSILNINNKEWYTSIAHFREMLKNLDDIIENLLSNVFLVADNLEEKINVLITILNFYRRDGIRESFMRKISEIWNAFKDELTSLSKTVSSGVNRYPTLFPKKSGQYVLLRIKFERISRLKDLLERCRFFPQCLESDEILALFETCEKQVKVALKTCNDLWIKSVSTDVGSWYHRYLICRSQTRPGLLECHIERRMLVIFEESYLFKVSGAIVPSTIDMDRNDNVKLTFDNVIRIVLYFNNVISSISDKERLFFKPMIQQTERKLEPLRGRFTWEEDLGEYIDTFVTNVKDLLDIIQVYKKENTKISNRIESIYNILLFKLSHDKGQLLPDFINEIKNQKRSSISELVRMYLELSKHIFCIFETIGSNIRKMRESWIQYVQKVDRLLKAAVFNSSLNTLEGILMALQKESTPILCIELMLNKHGITYQPSLESIETALKRLPNEVTSIIKIIPSMCQRFQIDSDCSFYEEFLQDSRFKTIEKTIHKHIHHTIEELCAFREKWNVFRPFWSINRKAFMDKFKLSSMTSEAFQKNNEKFEELLNQLATQRDSTICKCVEIDALKLKFAITSHINDWQIKYIEYLKCVSYGRIIEFHQVLKHNMEALSVKPKEVEELKTLEKTYQACSESVSASKDEIVTITEYFNVLEKCVSDVLPEAYNLRRNIYSNWQQYMEFLSKVKEKIENYQNQFKLSMANDVAELKVSALEMLKMLEDQMPSDEEILPKEAFSAIDLLFKRLEDLEAQESHIKKQYKLLGIDYHPLDVIMEIRQKLESLRLVWEFVEKWILAKLQIVCQIYNSMNVEDIAQNIRLITCDLQKLTDILETNTTYPILEAVKTEFQNVRITFSIMVDMKASHMRERHLEKIQLMINFKNEPIESISIEAAISHGLHSHEKTLGQLCFTARKQFEIETELEMLENITLELRYDIQHIPKATFTISGADTLSAVLKSNLTVIDRLLDSPYRKPFQDKICCWEKDLNFINDLLETLILISDECSMLYEISKIISSSSELNDINEMFNGCYEKWTDLIEFLQKSNLILDICPHGRSFLRDVELLRKSFFEISINLNHILDNHRIICSRLYLLPNQQLIQMIAFPTDVKLIEKAMVYMFENIKSVNMRQLDVSQTYGNIWEIAGINTIDEESIEFKKSVMIEPGLNISIMINRLESSVFGYVKNSLNKCLINLKQNYFNRIDSGWLCRWPCQILIKSTQIENTHHIRNAIVQTSLLGKLKPLKMLRVMHVKLLKDLLTTKQNLKMEKESLLFRKKLESLLIVEINTRDVSEMLIKAKVSNIYAFEWISQIRSSWKAETKSCSVIQLNNEFTYGYELKKCDEPIFITSHTNRMMMTITGIIKSKYIPQLNDRTEQGHDLLKQLATEVATLFVTLCCSSTCNIADITRYIDGVMNLQAWICFNNIDELSSQARSTINDTIRQVFFQKSKRTTLNLKNAKSIRNFHIFAISQKSVSLLPAFERSVMRPISICVPDQTIIFENLLCLCGYKQYKKIASLIVIFHEYIRCSISSKNQLWTFHRMQKAILASRRSTAEEKMSEIVEIGCTLRDEFIPSLSETEATSFNSHIDSIFFNGDIHTRFSSNDSEKDYSYYGAFCSLNLTYSTYAEKKSKELIDAFENHANLIITGAECCGKSSLISVVLRILSDQRINFKQYYLNPMSLAAIQNTNSWNDNSLDEILKAILQSKTHKRKCIIFDGPLNGMWLDRTPFLRDCAESTNLNISNDENVVKLIIETVDLQCATPAYINRFSIINVASRNVTDKHIMSTWLERKTWPSVYVKDELKILIDNNLKMFLNFIHQQCKITIELTDVAVLHTFCALFENIFFKWDTKVHEKETDIREAIRKLFIFCCIWSIGGLMNETERLKFDIFVRELASDSATSFPLKGNIFQYYVNFTDYVSIWEQWSVNIDCSSEFVYTPENKPYHFIVSLLLSDKRPVLLLSDSTVGKSSLIRNILTGTKEENTSICISNLTSKTTVTSLRRILTKNSMKVSQEIIYPKQRKNLTWFIDDMHNIATNRLDILEFLRNFLEHYCWHDSNHLQRLKQTNVVAAMRSPIILGKHEASYTRLINKFHVIFHSKCNDENIACIFKRKMDSLMTNENKPNLLTAIPSATIDLIRNLSANFSPTPVQPRYDYSMKTISKIIDMFCFFNGKPNQTNGSNHLRLWIHECYRETYDILDRKDYATFYDVVNNTMLRYFDTSLHGLCPGNQSPIFCDALCQNSTYEDIIKVDSLRQHVQESVKPDEKPIIHNDAVEHVSKVLRILKSNAHIALIGNVGSGRETICRIAAQVVKNTSFKIMELPSFTEEEIVDTSMSSLFEYCKHGRTLCVVRIDNFEEISSNLLDMINSIIVNGTIDGYYPCSKNSKYMVPENTWLQIRNNLHFAILVPVERYQYWIIQQSYPSMMSKITKNCIHIMTEKSLNEISNLYVKKHITLDVPIIQESNNETSRTKQTRKRESLVRSTEERLQDAVQEAVTRIHSVVTQELNCLNTNMHVLDSWYFELLFTFNRIFHIKRDSISSAFKKFSNGIFRIKEATENVANLKIDLENQQEQIEIYQQEIDKFIENIQTQTANADLQNQEVADKREKIGAEEIICKELAAIAETDLNKAMPALNSAIAALDSLNKKDMNEIKSYARPPVKVELVLNAVMLLLGKEPSWTEAKRQLGEQKFLDTLKNYDRNNIPESTLKTIGGFVRNPELEPNKVGLVSKAAKSLMLWVRAIENYGKVYKYVGPKIRRMEDATNSLREKQQSLREAEQRLLELADQLTKLRMEYDNKMECKYALEKIAKDMRIKLKRSETLIDGLSEENTRWKNTADELKIQYAHLIGDSIIVAATLVYFGSLPSAIRYSLKNQWAIDLETLEISFTENCDIFSYFYSVDTLRKWHLAGLSNDELTVENATILLNSSFRSPLVVDPQGEIRRWLVQEDPELISYNLEDDVMQSHIETFAYNSQHILALNFRVPNINHFIQLQNNHLRHHSETSETNHKHSVLIAITAEDVPYRKKLKKIANMINFYLDKSGLEVKLLVTLIKHENLSLEERKDGLEQSIITNNETLKKLEENILRILNHSQLPLIENEELYDTLQASKQTASTVKDVLDHAALTKTDIEASREIYRSCAARASLLFFILEDLKYINVAYRFELDWYVSLFGNSLEKSRKDPNIEERKKKIIAYHTYNLFRYTCAALSLPDQTIYAFHLCVCILLETEVISPREFSFFLNGAGKIDRHEQIENPSSDWINPLQWDNITELDKLPGFRGIVQSFEVNNEDWRTWCLAEYPEEETVPEGWDRNLTLFQKYTLVRSIRLDRIIPCMKNFVATYLGKRFIEENPISLQDILDMSVSATPVILISDDEGNPLEELYNLNKSYKDKSNRILQHVSMDTESMASTVKNLKNCVKSQNWLYIDQCWQSKQFVAKFDYIQQYLSKIDPKSDFRLWIVMPNNKMQLPVHMLQSCLKYRCNNPTGIKHTMKQIFEQIGEESFKKIEKSKHHSNYKKLIFALAFFHALLTKRNMYFDLGWNMQYNFTAIDYKLSERLLAYGFDKIMDSKYKNKHQSLQSRSDVDCKSMEGGDELQWLFIRNVVLQVGYGTQFTNTWDKRIFETHCANIFRKELIKSSQCVLLHEDPYEIPRNGNFMSYLNFIKTQLPQEDGTKVLGQHENANIKYLESRSAYALQMLCLVQLNGEATVYDQQHEVTNLDKVKKIMLELLAMLPVRLDYDNAKRIAEVNKTHVNSCLMYETCEYNAILDQIRRNLKITLKVLSGEINISSELLTLFQDVQNNRIPLAWKSQSYLFYSTNQHLSDWIIELKRRVNHLRKWTETGQLSTDITLGLLLNPKLFIQSVMRMHADLYQIPLVDLTWEVLILQTMKPLIRVPIQDGFIGRNFYLYNGGWDIQDQCLVEPKLLNLIYRMPPILFKPILRKDSKTKSGYQCPCYYSSIKNAGSFIMEIELNPGNKVMDTWIKMNTCMLLNE